MPQIVAIVPAWNESKEIAATVAALKAQTFEPARIIVVANNCTDDTAIVAKESGAEVIDVPFCPGRKAEAINTAMADVLPELTEDDFVFMQDADTRIVPDFFERALATIEQGTGDVVCGRYAAPFSRNPLVVLQRNEFARDYRMTSRRDERTHILVGTSSFFPVRVLRAIHAARKAGRFPGGNTGYVYDEHSVTEDFELTLACETLGFKRASPNGAEAVTDAMRTVPDLWKQRVRWARGGIEDIHNYGWTKVTLGFRVRRSFITFSVLALMQFLATVGYTIATSGQIQSTLPWLILTGIFILDRVVTVRKTGKLGMLYAALLIPDTAFNVFHQVVYVAALWKAFVSKRQAIWHET